MLKKTFKTMGRHPFIFAIFGILAVYCFADDCFSTMALAANNYEIIGSKLYIYGKIVFAAVVLLAPFIYYIYLAVTDSADKGWYFRGIGRGWYKYLLVAVLMSLLGTQLWLLGNRLVPSESVMSFPRMDVVFFIGRVGYALASMLTYLLAVPLIAEKRLSVGLKNVFTVGRKYVLRFFLAYVILYFLSWTPGINIYFGKLSIFGYYIMGYRSLITAAVQVFLYTYCMTMYVNYREQIIENREDEEIIDA